MFLVYDIIMTCLVNITTLPVAIIISTILPLTDPLPQGIINPLVVQCVAYLNREEVLVEPGLFRIPGDLAAVRKLRTAFLTG